MPRMLAVNWDRHEARYVLAVAHGQQIEVHAAVSVPLVDVVEAGSEPHPDLGNSLRPALSKEKVGRVVTLVGVDRRSIELLHLTLPPAQDAELPELVANQAIRESQNITEESALDFLPMDDNPAQPRRVAAAALLPGELEQIQQTCAVAGLKPSRMLLRPYASASLFARAASQAEPVCLLVNLLGDEADLTVLVEGKVTFSRTVRLPHLADQEKVTSRIVAEINRTQAVGLQTQPDTGPVRCVYVFGRAEEHQHLLDQIHQELSLPAKRFDPFEAVRLRGLTPPENAGRFASLLGMLFDEACGGAHAIDFLHPRRTPKPVGRGRVAAMAAAAVLAVVVAAGYLVWNKLAEIDQNNRNLTQKLSRLVESLDEFAQDRLVAGEVQKWQAGDVLWLEELRELSIRLPADRDAVILRMSMTPARTGDGGGVIAFEGLVSDSLNVTRMEHQLRDRYHHVRSPSIQERAREKNYPWHFNTSVFVAKRDKSQYTSHLPPPDAVDADAPKVAQGGSEGESPRQADKP